MGYRIAILHQGFVPSYRKRFFELLNDRTCNRYVVFHGQPPSHTGHVAASGPFQFSNVRVHNRELRLGKYSLIYQPVVLKVLRGGFDAIVVGHEFKLLAGQMLFAAYKLLRKPALLWGHGYHRRNAHPLARAGTGVFAKLADGYLVYTSSGAAKLKRAGLSSDQIFVLHNTIDIDSQIEAHARFENASLEPIRREFGLRPDAHTLLYIGRVYHRKRCDQLITLIRRLNQDPEVGAVDLVIVGDGPDLKTIKASASDLPNVHFLGEVYDTDKVAKLMRVTTAMVNPGSVGLAVNHSFAHGVPVVTREHSLHSPELDYIHDDRNGFIVAGGMDEYVRAVRGLLVNPDLLTRLSAGALATRDQLGLDHMAKEFDCGVCQAIQRYHGPGAAIDRSGCRPDPNAQANGKG